MTLTPSRALSSTGISTIIALTRSGAMRATVSAVLAPSEVPPITACFDLEVVEQADHLLGEEGHRVIDHLGGPIGVAVPEQVHGHDPVAPGGHRGRQAVEHVAVHEQPVDEHERAVALAVDS